LWFNRAVRIDVWSDLVCPWCYIGKRRLEHALAQLPGAPAVDIVHRSFQLNPSAPMGATSPRRDYLRAKYGWSPSQAARIDAEMEQRAAGDGLEYHLTADGLTGNTFDAHRLVHLARDRGHQDETVERFFRAYFTEQRSLFDKPSLEMLAVESGLDAGEARTVLAGSDYGDAVAADIREARALGVSGVPFFVFDRRLGLSGAQPVEIFVDALRQANGHSEIPS
jgi:predicted DsbA family dithiol-disulfide isomerase